MKIIKKIVDILPYLLVFLSSLYPPTDPDLGWHLKYGEYFFQHGSVLRDNTFSVMMPNFHWANVSWGTDVLTYAAYAIGGFLGLSILSALVVTATFFFFSKASRLSLWDEAVLFPFILFLEKPLNNVSFRGQQISMMLLGILIYLLTISQKKPKISYLLIPLFVLWVNLHGEFFLGLALLGVWIFFSMVQQFLDTKKLKQVLKNNTRMMMVFFFSIIATIINPFGIGVHKDAISHVGSPLLKNVAEYLPFAMLSQLWWNQVIVAILLVLGLVFLFFKEKLSTKIPILGSSVLLYILSFNVRRFAWPAYYLTMPILLSISSFFKPDKQKATYIISSILLIVMLVIAAFDKSPNQILHYSWEQYCLKDYIGCSPKSMEYLVKNKLDHNLFSMYGWGGWIIWNYPKVKPTIDGRMHIWEDEKGYSAFAEYYKYEQNEKEIDKSTYDVVYASPNKPLYDHMKVLVEKKKWQLVYEDNFAGIFVRK